MNPADAIKPIKKLRTENPHIALDFDQLAYLHELGSLLHQIGLCRLWVIVQWSRPEFYYELSKRGIARGHSMIPAQYRPSFEALLTSNKPLPHITPHDLRHTAGTLMLRRKVPVEVVSKILGHANISITFDVYRHVLESERQEHVIDFSQSQPNQKYLRFHP